MHQPHKWSYFDMTLCQRLLLAMLPTLLVPASWPLFASLGAEIDEDPWWSLTLGLYGVLTAVCVMAPFVSASSYRWLRIAGIVAAVLVIPWIWTMAGEQLFEEPLFGDSEIAPVAVGMAVYALVFGGVLAVVAPLKITARYWYLLIIVGLSAGFAIGYLVDQICIFGNCSAWYDWMIIGLLLPAGLIWPLGFVMAVYFGRVGMRLRLDERYPLAYRRFMAICWIVLAVGIIVGLVSWGVEEHYGELAQTAFQKMRDEMARSARSIQSASASMRQLSTVVSIIAAILLLWNLVAHSARWR